MNERLTLADIERFWLKVNKSKRGCWIWMPGATKNGYGHLTVRVAGHNKTPYAHRISVFLYNGYVPERPRFVCHTCNEKLCVRPDHLYDGTGIDNALDFIATGQHHLASKTHCTNGHSFAIYGSIYIKRNGQKMRQCIPCHRERARQQWARERAS